jgi:hypothetical protein
MPGKMLKKILQPIKNYYSFRNAKEKLAPLIGDDMVLWERQKSVARNGPKVLIATSLGDYDSGAYLECVLAMALTMRGADVHVLLCDEALPACQMAKLSRVTPLDFARGEKYCSTCYSAGNGLFSPLNLPIHRYSSLVSAEERQNAALIATQQGLENVSSFKWNGMAVGEHAYAGALRYFARGDLEGESEAKSILRRYLEAAMITVFAVNRLLSKNSFDVVVFHHGIYVPQGLIGEVCRKRGDRVVNSNPAYRKQTFIFSHDDSYHHTMISEPVESWEAMEWTSEKDARIDEYLKSRWYGTNDWIWFHERPLQDIESIQKSTGIDFSRDTVCLLTSVMWDAQLHYGSNAFSSMLEWVYTTIEHYSHRPQTQLVIRVHPAEVSGAVPSRQLMVDEIARRFPELPQNIFVIGPESDISTYVLAEKCRAALIYNTKTGIELAARGIPVVVAGEAWIRGKGFSIDVSDKSNYSHLLDTLPNERMASADVVRARKYAYHFFFRRMIDLPFISSPGKFEFEIDVNSLSHLGPGFSKGLDIICDGILKGTPFAQDE